MENQRHSLPRADLTRKDWSLQYTSARMEDKKEKEEKGVEDVLNNKHEDGR